MQSPLRRVRNLQRYYRIVTILARHGFGSLLRTLQIDRYLPLPSAIFRQRAKPAKTTPAEHFRLALEELGPTFIKLGQILSTRPDILPADFIEQLIRLQDNVPPNPWPVVQSMLQEEYGDRLNQVFASIDPEPIGSASLSQVHAARLIDGSEVVVKVQRPNIFGVIQSDLDILHDLARMAQQTAPGKLYKPVEIVGQFAYTLQNELDYRREGLNADRFRENFRSERNLCIPRIYWQQSTSRVLVMERLQGIKVDDFKALDEAGVDRRVIALKASGMLVKEVMEDGFFHADPHSGNYFVMPGANGMRDPILGVVDFGMVGHISKADRRNLIQAFSLADKMDAHGIVDLMLRIGAVQAIQIDAGALERDLDRMLYKYRGLGLSYIDIPQMMEEFMHLAYQYRIYMPPDLWMLFKAISMMDGLARRLDPEVDVFVAFAPHVRRLVTDMHMPWSWGPEFMESMESLNLAMRDLPAMGENLLRSLQRGELPFSIMFGANKQTLDRLDRVSTRFSLSLLAAAFILGLAILLPLASTNQVALVLVAVGFVISLVLGLWVAVSILRSGR